MEGKLSTGGGRRSLYFYMIRYLADAVCPVLYVASCGHLSQAYENEQGQLLHDRLVKV